MSHLSLKIFYLHYLVRIFVFILASVNNVFQVADFFFKCLNRWKTLDSAALKLSSVSFFEEEKHETAVSKWARARTRAAKVGKGLSKDEKAQKLALQHWLEAVSLYKNISRNETNL